MVSRARKLSVALGVLFIGFALSGCRPSGRADALGSYCVIMHHCDVWKKGDHESISACVEMIDRQRAAGYAFYEEEVRCVLAAGKDCDRVYSCRNEGRIPETCEAALFQDSCTGSMAVSCTERGLILYDDCVHYREDFSLPFDYSCVDVDRYARCEPPSCAGFPAGCSGSTREYCEEEKLVAEDCVRTYGSAVCDIVQGAPRCVGTGSACGQADAARCEGDRLVQCVGGKEAKLDCTSLGPMYTCLIFDGEATCAGAGTECPVNPEDDPASDSCRGPVLSYCHAGFNRTLNCQSLGFKTCAWRPDRGVAWCE